MHTAFSILNSTHTHTAHTPTFNTNAHRHRQIVMYLLLLLYSSRPHMHRMRYTTHTHTAHTTAIRIQYRCAIHANLHLFRVQRSLSCFPPSASYSEFRRKSSRQVVFRVVCDRRVSVLLKNSACVVQQNFFFVQTAPIHAESEKEST